jgi:hypothetical protein
VRRGTLCDFIPLDWNLWRTLETQLHSTILNAQHGQFNLGPDPNPLTRFPA